MEEEKNKKIEEEKEIKEQQVEEKNELEEMTDRYKRLLAEFENFKKRSQKERENLYNMITGDVVSSILPVMDNLEKADGTYYVEYETGKKATLYEVGSKFTYDSSNTSLYAVWDENQVTFYDIVDGKGKEINKMNIPTDKKIKIPTDKMPTKEGYEFKGYTKVRGANDEGLDFENYIEDYFMYDKTNKLYAKLYVPGADFYEKYKNLFNEENK